jgi:hypothetical protein
MAETSPDVYADMLFCGRRRKSVNVDDEVVAASLLVGDTPSLLGALKHLMTQVSAVADCLHFLTPEIEKVVGVVISLRDVVSAA